MKDWKNKELLKIGWQKTKENLWFLVGLEVLVYLANYLGSEIRIGFLVSLLTTFIFVSVVLRISRGQKADFNNLFVDFSGNKLAHYIVAMIIVTIFTVVGLALFIVPGVIVAIMTCFVVYILVDAKKDLPLKSVFFWKSIKESFAMTKGGLWKLFVFFLVLILVNMLGCIALVVGLLVSMPVSAIALATLYDKLKNVAEVVPVGNVSEPAPSETVS